MTPTQKVLIEQAIDHLINLQPKLANGLLNKRQLEFIDPYVDEAIKALRAALAEPVGEPVAAISALRWMRNCWRECAREGIAEIYGTKGEDVLVWMRHVDAILTKPPAEVPLLTDDEIDDAWMIAREANEYPIGVFARSIEALVLQKAGLK